ncbi:unnamed protein product [Symbiodinium sp. CCMP2592]|nr:unnamed protein product [Symbiodinium sp. CCMP2592]
MVSPLALLARVWKVASQRPSRAWLPPAAALAAASIPRWITISAVLGLLLFFLLQEIKLQAAPQEDGPEKKLLELKFETGCRKTAVAAALSSWIYNSGSRCVRIKVYSDDRRAAYYDYESADMTRAPRGIIPGGWCVPVIKELSKMGRDGVSHPCLLVRYLSLPVLIWKMHTEDVGRFALVMEAADCYSDRSLARRVGRVQANSQVTVLGDAKSNAGVALLLLAHSGQRVYVVDTASIYALDQCVEIKPGGANFFRSNDFAVDRAGVIPEGAQLPQLGAGTALGRDGVRYPYLEVLYLGCNAFVWQWRTKEPAFREREVKQALGRRLSQEVEVADVQFPRPTPLSPSAALVVLKMPRPAEAKEPDQRETMIVVVWQGTEFDKRPLDLFTDLAAAPVRAQMWHDSLPGVWAHSGIYAKVQSDVLQHEESLKGKVSEALSQTSGRCHILFTGHSLGGGAALIAHLCFLVRWQDWLQREPRLTLESTTFAAPMVFYLAEGKAHVSPPLLSTFKKPGIQIFADYPKGQQPELHL